MLRFPEKGFSVEVPAGWVKAPGAEPETLVALKSPDETKAIFVHVARFRLDQLDHDFAVTLAGLRRSFVNGGMQADPDRKETINGMTFTCFDAHGPGGS